MIFIGRLEILVFRLDEIWAIFEKIATISYALEIYIRARLKSSRYMNTLDKIKHNIAEMINQALEKKLVKAADLVYPPKPEFGDLSLPCFNLAKEFTRRRGQNKTAVEMGEFLVGRVALNETVVAAKAIGPFINFTFNKQKLAQGIIKEILKSKEQYGLNKTGKNKKILVEFAHPNTHKAFHI